MTHEEWKAFEDTLINRGYRVWSRCCYGEEDFDVSIMVREYTDDEPKDLYQLIFRFWDFEKYKEGAGYSVDFVVMPCIDGRMDAICSAMANDLDNNVEFAEKFAKDYYKFVAVDVKASKEGFIAGAELQERHAPLPEDTVLFQKGVEEGKRLIMEEAVEGEIGYWNQRGLSIRLDKSLERLGYGEGTEVRIIIVKQ